MITHVRHSVDNPCMRALGMKALWRAQISLSCVRIVGSVLWLFSGSWVLVVVVVARTTLASDTAVAGEGSANEYREYN